MSENAIITAASVIGAGLVCLGAAMGAGFGNGNMCGKSIESMPILSYVIAIVLVFANPFIK